MHSPYPAGQALTGTTACPAGLERSVAVPLDCKIRVRLSLPTFRPRINRNDGSRTICSGRGVTMEQDRRAALQFAGKSSRLVQGTVNRRLSQPETSGRSLGAVFQEKEHGLRMPESQAASASSFRDQEV